MSLRIVSCAHSPKPAGDFLILIAVRPAPGSRFRTQEAMMLKGSAPKSLAALGCEPAVPQGG